MRLVHERNLGLSRALTVGTDQVCDDRVAPIVRSFRSMKAIPLRRLGPCTAGSLRKKRSASDGRPARVAAPPPQMHDLWSPEFRGSAAEPGTCQSSDNGAASDTSRGMSQTTRSPRGP